VSERPRVLEDLGVELDRTARRTLAVPRTPLRAPHRLSVVVVIVVLLVLAAAAAAAILITSGSPLPAPHAQDLQSGGIPLASSVHLAGLDAPDPEAGAPSWEIRLSRTRAGETCTAVGQVLNGQFGIVGLDHVFRVLPLGGVDACGFESADGPVLAGARVFSGSSSMEARTVVNGVAGAGVRSVTAYGPEGPRALRLGPDGSFITVYRGYVEDVRPRIVVVGPDGVHHTVAFAQSSAFEVADPQGGAPWQISGDADIDPGSYPDEDCAQVTRARDHSDPRFGDTSLTPEVCGRLGEKPLFVLMRRFVPGTGEGTGFPWGNNPARTLVYGAAAPRVASLTLSGAGGSRALAIDPHGGVFVAVLDGHVDPRSLTLSARLRDGSTLTYRHSANLLAYQTAYQTNGTAIEPPVPAYREPLPSTQPSYPPFEIPVASTLRETVRVADPAGGPQWVLHSWQGVPNPKASGASAAGSSRIYCFQFGVIVGGKLAQPRTGSAPVPWNPPGDPGGQVGEERCNDATTLARKGPLFSAESYLADPYAYAPRSVRTVVSGQLPPGAVHALLIGAGEPRPVRADANHAFLLVLPGRYWDSSLHVAYTVGGRTVGLPARQPAPAGKPNGTAPEARAPDPDGGAPWGFAVHANGSNAFGRIVDGRLADIEEERGTVVSEAVAWGSGIGEPPGERPQVAFDTQTDGTEGGIGMSAPVLTRPEMERRTLPGRTIITGIVMPDVISVTLATPSDVRTLRPSGPHHVLIAVYDGAFYQGLSTATIRLGDGRAITETLRGGVLGAGGGPRKPSFARLLFLFRREAERVERNRSLTPAERRRELEREQLTARAQVVMRRIAYEHAHPGELPAP
jgi:hypothetical protein